MRLRREGHQGETSSCRALILVVIALGFLPASCGVDLVPTTPLGIVDHATDPANQEPLHIATATQVPATPMATRTPLPELGALLLGYWPCASAPCRPGNMILDDGGSIRVGIPRRAIEGYDLGLEPIGAAGYRLQDVSPDASALLLSKGSGLFKSDLDGGNLGVVADNFATSYEANAFWMPFGAIAYIGTEGTQRHIYLVEPDGTNRRRLTSEGMRPLRLFASKSEAGVLWEAGWPKHGDVSVSDGLRWSTLNGDTTTLTEMPFNADVSSLGVIAHVTWLESQMWDEQWSWVRALSGEEFSIILLDTETMETSRVSLASLPGEYCGVSSSKWTPDGRHLALLLSLCEGSDGGYLQTGHRAVLVDSAGKTVGQWDEVEGVGAYATGQVTFSPDGGQFISLGPVSGVAPTGTFSGYEVILYDIKRWSATNLFLRTSRPLDVQRVIWLPASEYPSPPIGARIPARTAVPTWTPGPSPTRPPSVQVPVERMEALIEDVLWPIERSLSKQFHSAGSSKWNDPFLRKYFPSGFGMNAMYTFYSIPLPETCSFIERQYRDHGWPELADRNLVLVTLVDMLGNPSPSSKHPYCANFDPAQNPDLGFLPTTTPIRLPTAIPADPGL